VAAVPKASQIKKKKRFMALFYRSVSRNRPTRHTEIYTGAVNVVLTLLVSKLATTEMLMA
jgi:hypothetical protein